MQNIMAMAIRLHLETIHRIVTKEEAANYVYSLDSKTDNEKWVAPLDPFIGPAGARRSRNPIVPAKRVFEFCKDDGTEVKLNVGC